jgi:glycosyltransferase involved in cell wall biosynthesis
LTADIPSSGGAPILVIKGRRCYFTDIEKFRINKKYVIKCIKGLPYKKNVSVGRYCHHKLVARRFRELAKLESHPDVIVAATPDYDLAYEAIRYASSHIIPSLVDVVDLWPDSFLAYLPNSLKIIWKYLLIHDVKKIIALTKNADALIAVSEGYLKWALKKAGRLQNTWDRSYFLGHVSKSSANFSVKPEYGHIKVEKFCKNKKAFIFVGSFGISYDLNLILKAAHIFYRKGHRDVCFIMAGNGEQGTKLRRAAEDLPNILFTGWIGETEIRELLEVGHAGLMPYKQMLLRGYLKSPSSIYQPGFL